MSLGRLPVGRLEQFITMLLYQLCRAIRQRRVLRHLIKLRPPQTPQPLVAMWAAIRHRMVTALVRQASGILVCPVPSRPIRIRMPNGSSLFSSIRLLFTMFHLIRIQCITPYQLPSQISSITVRDTEVQLALWGTQPITCPAKTKIST